jgi:predicted NBD/HSP70 family sugar kinase
MYLGIDIGGTKTLVATLDGHGVITEKLRFPTPQKYSDFIKLLASTVADLSTNNFIACTVGVPGRLDRNKGVGIAMGNLPWVQVPIQKDVQHIVDCSVLIENDAKLAGLSEAMLVKGTYNRVLFVTISTGIGVGFIVNQTIDQAMVDSEGGQILVEHGGKVQHWEDLASGEAIVRLYGKRAKDIQDVATWRHIAHNIGLGLSDLISVIQPEVIIIGGSIGTYFEQFKKPLMETLHRYELPITPVPPIIPAARSDDAVLYGCYDFAKASHGKAHS